MTIQTDAVTEALHKAVEGREAYVYEKVYGRCLYAAEDGSPSCIVGHVVAAVAPKTYESLRRYEERTQGSVSAGVLGSFSGITPMDVEERVIRALDAAQTVQDNGAPWRYAQMAYDRVIEGADPWGTITAIQDLLEEEK